MSTIEAVMLASGAVLVLAAALWPSSRTRAEQAPSKPITARAPAMVRERDRLADRRRRVRADMARAAMLANRARKAAKK